MFCHLLASHVKWISAHLAMILFLLTQVWGKVDTLGRCSQFQFSFSQAPGFGILVGNGRALHPMSLPGALRGYKPIPSNSGKQPDFRSTQSRQLNAGLLGLLWCTRIQPVCLKFSTPTLSIADQWPGTNVSQKYSKAQY